jgi:hypothetical protein
MINLNGMYWEKFKFDENGKVIKSSVYYGIEEENTNKILYKQ